MTGARAPGEADLERAVARLRAGELVAFPTETVYGLGGAARDPAAVAKIYALKSRPAEHPLIVHLAEHAPLEDWARDVPPAARLLARAFWPGPLTLVLPRAASVPAIVTGGQDTVGLRKPSHPLARRLLEAFGDGIAAPSANRYRRISPTTAAHVHAEFGADAPLVLDGGPCEVGLESTIVGCLDGELVLLRPGGIDVRELARVAGPIALPRAHAVLPRVSGSEATHYAPHSPTSVLPAALLSGARVDGAGVLARHAAPPTYAGPGWIVASEEPRAYARALYANLRLLDALRAREILVEALPEGPDWDAARDRLQRAARR